MLTPQAIDNAWRHFWSGHLARQGGVSLLKLDPLEPSVVALLRPQQLSLPMPMPAIPKPAKPRRNGAAARPRPRAKLNGSNFGPISDWAQGLVGDGRIDDITLDDVLDGIDDYFAIFAQMRRIDPGAYAYFSKVGVPLVFHRATKIYARDLETVRIPRAAALPSFFGAFIPRSKDVYRKDIFEDRPSLADFIYFLKPKNHATVAPRGTTIFTHHEIILDRKALTPEELKQYPYMRGHRANYWYAGVLPTGEVRALPCHTTHHQRLPSGDSVHHSSFQIPPSLTAWTKLKDPHDFARIEFVLALAFTISALTGVQVIIRKGKQSARFGIPLAKAKSFFRDRDATGRRRPIMHLRLGHDRRLANGRVITVGEHLSGERAFSWRGYDITLGVPGIHYPSPEGFTGPLYVQDDPDAPLTPEEIANTVPVSRVGNLFQEIIQQGRRPPFRRGQPSRTYSNSTLTLD